MEFSESMDAIPTASDVEPIKVDRLDLKFNTKSAEDALPMLDRLWSLVKPSSVRFYGVPPTGEGDEIDLRLFGEAKEISVVGNLGNMRGWSKILTDLDNAGQTLPPATFLIHTCLTPASTVSPSSSAVAGSPMRTYRMAEMVEFLTAVTPWKAAIGQATVYLLDDLVLKTSAECDVHDFRILLDNSVIGSDESGDKSKLRLASRAEYIEERRTELEGLDLEAVRRMGKRLKEDRQLPRTDEVTLLGEWHVNV